MNVRLVFSSIILGLMITGCSEGSRESDQQIVKLPDTGLEISGLWARPGSAGGVSAVYFTLANGDEKPDTLTVIESNAASTIELHETYQREGDMMGMRQIEIPVFDGNKITFLKPGGLHIMLIELLEPLAVEDSLQLTLTFARNGKYEFQVPVQGKPPQW